MSESRMAWIAEDPASKAVMELARKVADTSTTLLITGESGTGKDHLARLIHELGPRRDAPFLKIDCASLPQELVESELFGHERGAFTGAVERKLGRLEMAQGGTIVLDEVAALSPATQSKMLRVLEERQFERLGGTETITIQARLIALTNSDLPRLVAEGLFREDLFFRLSVLTIAVPALRARPADILPLADALLERAARVHGRVGTLFSEPVRHMLAAYAWPGNVRELKNSIERALVFSSAPMLATARFSGIGAIRGFRPGGRAAVSRRDGTRRHSSHARCHALQDRKERRDPGHQPQDPARQTKEIRIELKLGHALMLVPARRAARFGASAHENPPCHARENTPPGNPGHDGRLRGAHRQIRGSADHRVARGFGGVAAQTDT